MLFQLLNHGVKSQTVKMRHNGKHFIFCSIFALCAFLLQVVDIWVQIFFTWPASGWSIWAERQSCNTMCVVSIVA